MVNVIDVFIWKLLFGFFWF